MSKIDREARAKELFFAAHAEDPRRIATETGPEPFAVGYHRALARWVDHLVPDASEPLRLAALSQHIRRHLVPRESFPMDLIGYKRWRSTLAQKHASEARAILESVGYDEPIIERVTDFLLKKSLRKDTEVGLFEDAICLVFLEIELASFAEKHPEDKVVDIIRKTWAKMTPRGHEEAVALLPSLSEPLRRVVERAVSGT